MSSFILLFVGIISQSHSFVTQLPDCGRYHSNFTERHDNKYLTTTVGDVIKNVTRRECGLHCTLFLGCLFFNHKMDNSVCELLTSYKGDLAAKPGWQFVSTSIKNVHLRGPLCRYLGPGVCSGAGDRGKHCADTCVAPGIECKADVNIAGGKPTQASSRQPVQGGGHRSGKYAVDGDPNTFWAPNDGPEDPQRWLRIDLEERRYVAYLWLQHLDGKSKDKHYNKMKGLRVRIGDKREEADYNGNEVCAENLDHSAVRNNLIYCTGGPIWGQYVVLDKPGGANTLRFFVNELQIFALD